jgi:threonine dehydrogenase-like Zn-dependent dehydrogenase
MVLDKMRTDGLMPTVEAVCATSSTSRCRWATAMSGEVHGSRRRRHGFAVGDRVVSNGKHAEMVSVPVNLCAKVPDAVADDEAAFTVVGAIGCRASAWRSPRWAKPWWSPAWA